MIAQIRGTLISSTFTEAVVDVGGVGYRAFIPMSTYDTLPQPGGEVTLLTHMHVREDAIILFGFATRQEQAAFELLITVNGIGAKTALNIMSCMNITSLCAAIAGGDVKTLKRISGVGPKSAERMIVELRDKVDAIVPEAPFLNKNGEPARLKEAEDAVLALGQLGFQGPKVQKLVNEIAMSLPENERSSENILRKSIQALNK